MPTNSEILQNRAIRHMAYLQGVATYQANLLSKQMSKDYDKKIMEAISALIIELASADSAPRRQQILQQIAAEINQATSSFRDWISGPFTERIKEIAAHEADFEYHLWDKTLPASTNIQPPKNHDASHAVSTAIVGGKTLQQWWREFHKNTIENIVNALSKGARDNETVDQLVKRVKGTKDHGYKNGEIGTQREVARALAITATLLASNSGRRAFFLMNSQMVVGYQVVVTLDAHTCLICISYNEDNPYDYPPGAPFHIRCRCIDVPILAGDDMPKVPSYADWLKLQPESVQKEVLGPQRWKMWHSGKIDITSFTSRKNKIYTLDQLRRMEGDIFNNTTE